MSWLSPVSWAKWTWTAVRGGEGEDGEGEEGRGEEGEYEGEFRQRAEEEEEERSQGSSSDSEGHFETPEAATPVHAPPSPRELENNNTHAENTGGSPAGTRDGRTRTHAGRRTHTQTLISSSLRSIIQVRTQKQTHNKMYSSKEICKNRWTGSSERQVLKRTERWHWQEIQQMGSTTLRERIVSSPECTQFLKITSCCHGNKDLSGSPGHGLGQPRWFTCVCMWQRARPRDNGAALQSTP
ncbi:unnamed protein product [Arctogadus glacialis]